jgi:hypothetical protein
MKILSLRQPWAHLVVSGTKDIENRTWSTNYRGPFLVHASLNIDKEACRAHRLDPAKLEGGGVVGMAEIIDVVTEHRSKWFLGPFEFVLQNRRPVPFVPWPGSSGLRDAPPDLMRLISL